MIDLTYTDPEGIEQGVILAYALDLAYGSDENDFELTLPIETRLDEKSLVYIDGTEWGGIVRGGRESTMGETPVFVARGETWHGRLAETYICPVSDHVSASGEANAAIAYVIDYVGLGDVFAVSKEQSGISVSHRFDRFADCYSGIRKMLASSGAKLRIEKQPGGKPMLSAVPIGDYVDGEETNRYGYRIEWYTPVNHLICLGMGELEERTVIHLYADAEGNVSQTQTMFGLDEKQAIYEYNNVDEAQLIEDGTKKLKEMQGTSGCELSLPEDMAYDVGDMVGIASEKTGRSVISTVSKVIVKVSGDGRADITNEIGEIAIGRYSPSGASSFSGGVVYKAGDGIEISGATIKAKVTERDLAGKSDKSHSHNWESVTGKPNDFPPSDHSHSWSSVADKPETFAPSEHAHDGRYYTESEIDGKLKSKSDTTHAHEWGDIGGKPGTFPPSSHMHGWGDVTGKPESFPPSNHSHSWDGIEGKPEKFPPSGHGHDASKIVSGVLPLERGGTGGETAAEARANLGAAASDHGHGWADITGKPESYPPASHNHDAAYAAKAHAHDVATKTAAGFMSAEDKAVIESLSGGAVTGVKGSGESAYRTGNVSLTAANVGAASTNRDGSIGANDANDQIAWSATVNGRLFTMYAEPNGFGLWNSTGSFGIWSIPTTAKARGLEAYPVGSVYMSWSSTSPASLFGGSWVAITGRFPYFNAGTGAGGSNTHTLSVNEMPSHAHQPSSGGVFITSGAADAMNFAAGNYRRSHEQYTSWVGGSGAHNNMPAYQSFYAWRRTA